MAQFIQPTLEALANGDIKADDAAYTLTAHIVARSTPATAEANDLSTSVSAIVLAVDEGRLSPQEGAARLVELRTRLEAPPSANSAD